MEKDQFNLLVEKLDLLTKLIAASVVAGKSLTDQVEYLSSVGLTSAQISATLGKPSNTVTGILARLKNRKKV